MNETTVTVTVNHAALNHLLRSPSGAVGQWMLRVTNRAQTLARQGARVDTGYNRSRIDGRVTESPEGIVGELVGRTGYARWVEDGTRFMEGDHNLRDSAFRALRETR